MGTSYIVRVAVVSDSNLWPPDLEDLQERVDARLAEINRLMSTYDPNSELSRFNRSDSTEWFTVSPKTAEVVSAGLRIADETNGAFDPTVGPVVNLWGFGPSKKSAKPPTDEQIAEALGYVGYELLEVRTDPPAIRKEQAQLYLDLSGIAKGYASDEISDLLNELGYSNSMVEIGGEVRTRGTKARKGDWRIGVQKPGAMGNPVQMALPLKDAALATSGDYRNFFEHEGQHYSHTIDPNTGRPVEHGLASATIVANSCMEADALATAVLVMGDEKGLNWCEARDVAALLLTRKGDAIIERPTKAFLELSRLEEPKSMPWLVLVIAMVVFGISLCGMAIGVILSNRRLKGSCGGLASLKDSQGNTMCEACTNPSPECQGEPLQEEEAHQTS